MFFKKINARYPSKSASISPQNIENPNLSILVLFLQVVYKFLWLEDSKHSKTNKYVMQCAISKIFAVFCFKKYFKNDLDELEIKQIPKATFLMQSLSVFRDVYIVGRMKTFNSEQMRYRARLLNFISSSTFKKDHKMTPKWSERNKFWQFDNLVNSYRSH